MKTTVQMRYSGKIGASGSKVLGLRKQEDFSEKMRDFSWKGSQEAEMW